MPPRVQTTGSIAEPSGQQETLQGDVPDMGDSATLQVSFDIVQSSERTSIQERPPGPRPIQTIAKPGPFSNRSHQRPLPQRRLRVRAVIPPSPASALRCRDPMKR